MIYFQKPDFQDHFLRICICSGQEVPISGRHGCWEAELRNSVCSCPLEQVKIRAMAPSRGLRWLTLGYVFECDLFWFKKTLWKFVIVKMVHTVQASRVISVLFEDRMVYWWPQVPPQTPQPSEECRPYPQEREKGSKTCQNLEPRVSRGSTKALLVRAQKSQEGSLQKVSGV